MRERHRRSSITAFVSPEEKEMIRQRAKELKMPVSAYVKKCLGAGHCPGTEEYDPKEGYITLQEFARHISVSRSKARDICRENDISYSRIGGSYRIKKKDADEYLKEQQVERKRRDELSEPLLTVADVALKYHVTHQTVDQWIRKGKMKALKIDGKHIRIRPEDSDSMLSVYKPKGK